jgi:hypothetical protein
VRWKPALLAGSGTAASPSAPARAEGLPSSPGPASGEVGIVRTSSRTAEATVLLTPEALQAFQAGQTTARLEIVKDGSSTLLPLETDRFVIGREASVVDYIEDVPGVSKLHVEILKRDGGYTATDLGSTNGTRLNGEEMIPYKSYPLRHGDVLHVLRTQYILKTEQL